MDELGRRKAPKIPGDGPGPRGVPDTYHTARVLNSTFRYVRFVKKLRALEEEVRKGEESNLKARRDQQISDFFIRCDRSSLIKKVSRNVDLCLQSYEKDLEMKKQRLREIFEREEEENIRKFVEKAQAGSDLAWEQKKARLQYLLDKRQKEHEERYKDTPLSKCTDITPCLVKLRAKEAQQIQLYQMREKQARELTDKEYEKMWHEVAMKEAEALTARMELDAIQSKRKALECQRYSDAILAQRREREAQEREQLKREQLALMAQFEEDLRNEQEAIIKREEKRKADNLKQMKANMEQEQIMQERRAEQKAIEDTWHALTMQGLKEDQDKMELARRRERDQVECNRHLLKMANPFEKDVEGQKLIDETAKKQQEVLDRKRCEYLLWSQKTNRDVRTAMIDQIKERQAAREVLKKKLQEEKEYQRQLLEQTDELCKYRMLREAADRKRYQQDLLDQIEYNKLLKERALQEELDQRRKAKAAADQYQADLNRMLQRTNMSDEVHPFLKRMQRGIDMNPICPCSCPDYCLQHCATAKQ